MLSAWNSVPLGNDLFGRLMLSQILSIFLSFYFKVMWDEWGGLWHNVRGSAMDFNRLLIHWRHLYYICAEWWGLARGPPGASQPCHLLATLWLHENDEIPELAKFLDFQFSGKRLSLCRCLKMMKSQTLLNFGISFSGKHLPPCGCLKMMKSLNLLNFGISNFPANTCHLVVAWKWWNR